MTRDFSTGPRRRAGWSAGQRGLVAGAGLVLGLLSWLALSAWNDHRYAWERVQAARQGLAEARSRAQLADSRERPQDAAASLALLTAQAPPARVVAALAALLPPDVRLDGLTLKYGERVELDLRVAARDAQAYDLFLSRLEASPLFERVEPGDEGRDGEVRTTVHAALRRGLL